MEEGQRVYALAGETPAHPNVEPVERIRPAAAYMLSQDDVKQFPNTKRSGRKVFKFAEAGD